MPRLGMCAHCHSDSLIPAGRQEFLCMFVVREMLDPLVISKPGLGLGQSLGNLKKGDFVRASLVWSEIWRNVPITRKNQGANEAVCLAVCKIKGPFAGRSLRLTDTTILTTCLLKIEQPSRSAESQHHCKRRASRGLTFAWGEKHQGVSPGSPQTSLSFPAFLIKESLCQVLPVGTKDTQRSLYPVISPLFSIPTALHRAQNQFPGPF